MKIKNMLFNIKLSVGKNFFFAFLIISSFIYIPVFAQKTSTKQSQKYTAPALESSDSWSIILLPDPQTYSKFGRNQPVFELMTSWISENINPLNIKMVLCTGDLVEQNEYINPDGVSGNQPSKSQWESVARAFGRLDGRVPYVTALGNHDYGYKSIENRTSNFNKHFPVDKNFKNQEILREVGMNAQNIPTLENAAFEFTSSQGRKILVLSLEFAPRDTTVNWAKKVVNQEKYKDHTVIVLTHSYMNSQNEHIVKEKYPIENGNYGKALFEKLIEPSKNIQMVFAGHIGAPNEPKKHIAFRTDTNATGKKVQQMVFNAQALGGGWMGNGGDGWLRILEFLPDGKTIKVKTFSPLFAISPTTQQFAWRTEPWDEFSFEID